MAPFSPEHDADPPPAEEPRQAGSVSVWLTHSGARRWSVRVPIGTDQADIDQAITIALAAEARLAGGADK